MARGITPEDWPAQISDAEIVSATGRRTFERGQHYVSTGHVLEVSVSGHGDIVSGQVRGSRTERYHTMVFAQRIGKALRWSGTCSCPVGRDCKHTAALLLAARDAALGTGAAASAWEAELTALLQVATPTSYRPMALEVAPADLGPWYGGEALGLLPLVAGKRGWNRQGASWSAVAGGSLAGTVDPRVLAPLQELASMAPGGSFYYSEDRVILTQLPAHAWEVLRRATGAGLTLTTAQHGGREVIIEGGLRAGVSVVVEEDGAAVVVPALDMSAVEALGVGSLAPVSSAASLGDPVHAFWVSRADGALVLMPLEPALPEALGRLLRVPDQRLVVPVEDVPRFEAEHLEALATAVPLLSLDPRLTVPEPARVVAVLRAEVDGQRHRAVTRWLMRYVTGSGEVRREVEPGATDPALGRDVAAEARLAARVEGVLALAEAGRSGASAGAPAPGGGTGWAGTGGRGAGPAGLLAPRTYTGMATAHFMTEVVPALAALDDVLVEVVGPVPHYHEAEEAPLVTTDVAEGESPDWFSLRVRVRVGSEDVPLERLMHAVAAHEDQVLLDSGTWVNVATAEIERLAALMEEGRHLADPGRRSEPGSFAVTAFQAGYYAELVALGVVGDSARRWQEGVERLLAATAAAEGGAEGGAEGQGARPGPGATGGVGPGGVGPDGDAGERSWPGSPGVDPPARLRAELRPYQLDGYRWLHLLHSAGLGGVLADDMGLGKTVQVLAVAQRLVEERDGAGEGTGTAPSAPDGSGPVLVVAPTSVVGTWVEQAARFCPGLRVRAVTRTAARRGTTLAQEVADADLLVTSYTIARIEEEDFARVDFSWVVLDEAQFVKNHTSATYKAVRRLRAPSTVAITGTPLENSLMDLWSLLSVSAPGLLPGPERFTELYRRPIEKGDTERLSSLRARMRPFLLRRTKEQVAAELPSKTEQVLSVELGARHRRAYEQRLIRERQKVLGLLEDDSATARFSALRSLTILRQMALDPALVDGPQDDAAGAAVPGGGGRRRVGGPQRSAKVTVLLDQLVPIVAEGHRALVFSQFTRYLRGVRDELESAGLRTAYLDGTTSDRQGVVDSFRQGGADVFLISLKAGGFGLTLTEADYVFLLDPWWNPQTEEQAVDRAHRIGQERPVMVYRLVAAGTIEEKVMALKEKKAELFDRVVEGAAEDAAPSAPGAPSRAALTAAEIRELMAP